MSQLFCPQLFVAKKTMHIDCTMTQRAQHAGMLDYRGINHVIFFLKWKCEKWKFFVRMYAHIYIQKMFIFHVFALERIKVTRLIPYRLKRFLYMNRVSNIFMRHLPKRGKLLHVWQKYKNLRSFIRPRILFTVALTI